MFKNIILASLGLLAVAWGHPSPKTPYVIGIGLALTGPIAQYGQMAKRGFDLALEEINASGGIHGQKLEIDYQDTQGDPKQAIAVARKFIANPKILMAVEVGTAASMATRSTYQKNGLVLLGPFTGQPIFTDEGDYIWCNALPIDKAANAQASYVKDLGLKKIAFVLVNSELGKSYGSYLEKALKQMGIEIVLQDLYLPDEKDFRSLISKIKKNQVDGICLVSAYNDGILLVRQIRELNLQCPIVAFDSLASDKFPQFAGPASEGVYIAGHIAFDDPRPEVVSFMKQWKVKYASEEPDWYAVHAYDSLILTAEAIKSSNGTRASVKAALVKIKDVPSVLNNKISFNPATRRIENFLEARLVVKGGKLVHLETKKPKE